MRTEIEDFRKALIEATHQFKPLIVFMHTEEGGITFRKVNIYVFKNGDIEWSVATTLMGEKVAGASGFASVEEAADDCAKWLSANGYSQLTPSAHAEQEQAMMRAFAADLEDAAGHHGSLHAEKRTKDGRRIVVYFSLYAYTCQPPFWMVSNWKTRNPIAHGKPTASPMKVAEDCVAWLAKHGYTRLFL